jgi:hypothetical protein
MTHLTSLDCFVLFAQADEGPPWWLYVVFVLVGLVMLGIGGYGIVTRRAIIGGRQQRLLSLFGINEVTGFWAILVGAGQCCAGVLMLLMAITGPFWAGSLADTNSAAPSQPHQSQPEPIAASSIPQSPTPRVNVAESPPQPRSTENPAPQPPPREKLLRAGSESGTPFSDAAPAGGVLVGLRCAKGKNWGGALQAVQPIYQVGEGYALGQRHGIDGGDEHQLLAKPGYAVGSVNARAGLVLNALQLVYYRINGQKLDATDRYESELIGSEGGGPFQLDPQGKPITEVFGTFHEDIVSLGVTPVEQLDVALSAPTATPPDLWSEPRPGMIAGVAQGQAMTDTAPAGGVLVGVRGYWDEEPQPTLRSLQPIYLAGDQYVFGKQVGEGGVNQTVLIARPGFRVGGFEFLNLGDIVGFQLKYTPLGAGETAAEKPYDSPWIGPDLSARAETAEAGERMAVGLVAYSGETLQGLGLMLAGAHTVNLAAAPAMPAELRTAAYARPRLRAGREDGLPFSDEAPAGALLAGLICVQGNNWGGALHGVQPIYQTSTGYVTGQRHGAPGGEEHHVVARPGYAVGAIKARAGLVLNAVQVVFYRIDGQRLDPNDRYESEWVGSDGGGLNELDGRGDPIIGVFGGWERDLLSIGLAPTALFDASPGPAEAQSAEKTPPAEDFRTWTSADGRFTLEAKFLRSEAGNVQLQRRDGATVAVPLVKLSQADAAYVSQKKAE